MEINLNEVVPKLLNRISQLEYAVAVKDTQIEIMQAEIDKKKSNEK
jgi:hypothetical protein